MNVNFAETHSVAADSASDFIRKVAIARGNNTVSVNRAIVKDLK